MSLLSSSSNDECFALLDDLQWSAQEKRLKPADLRGAEEIVVCNALRGAMFAEVV